MMSPVKGDRQAPTVRWAFLLALIGIEALAALAWLFSLPGEGTVSLRRLLLAAPLALGALAGLGLAALHWTRAGIRARLARLFDRLTEIRAVTVLVLAFLLAAVYFLLFGQALFDLTDEFFTRLIPDVFFLAAACLTWLVFLFPGRSPADGRDQPPLRIFLFALAWMLPAVLVALWVWVDAAPTASAYAGAGAPVLPHQFLGALFLFVAGIAMARAIPAGSRAVRAALAVGGAALFAFAVYLWLSTPVPVNYFMLPANTSDGAIYPVSDARLYDINAQDMLIGQGLAGGGTLPRPLYSFLLGMLHVFFGQEFTALVNVHAVLIALLPVGLYLLGRRLGHPWAGLLAGVLLVLREFNQTILSPTYTMASPRMLLSEGLTALLLAGFALLVLRWLKDPGDRAAALLAGAVQGLLLLLRTQTTLLAPLLILVLLAAAWQARRALWKPVLFFALGAALVVLPWMGRNLVRNGQFALEDTAYLNQVLSITRDETAAVSGTDAQESPGLGSVAARGEQVISYSLNSMMSSLSQLPLRFDRGIDPWTYVADGEEVAAGQDIDYYPYLRPDGEQLVHIFVHLLLVAAGLALAWSALGWAGIFPMLLYLTYDLSSALFGYSGWRFIQPVDWVVLLYWSLGAAGLIGWFLSRGLKLTVRPVPAAGATSRTWSLYPVLATAALAGLLLPVGEVLFPRQPAPLDGPTALTAAAEVLALPGRQDPALLALLDDPGAVIAEGWLYYPVYVYDARDVLLWRLSAAADIRPLMYFDLRGGATLRVVLRASGPDAHLPHTTRAIVVGCERDGLVDAAAVILTGTEPWIVYSRDGVPAACGDK